MDLSSINPILFVAGFFVAATPLIFAAIGELVVEKTGVLNLGVEGMMIMGAICGFATAVETGSPLLGFAAAAIGGQPWSTDRRPVFWMAYDFDSVSRRVTALDT